VASERPVNIAADGPAGYNPAAMRVSRKTIGLAVLAGLALGLRVWLVLALVGDHARPLGYEHGRIAENLLRGKGFAIEFLGTEGPTSQQAPFYPLLLAADYWCFGIDTPQSILAMQLLQCLAGTALVLAVVWLGWGLVPERRAIGWMAGVLAAIYPTHVYMVTHLQVALWAALLLTLLVAVVVSPRWQATWAGAALAGCLSGMLLLVEPILALALPILAAAVFLQEGGATPSRAGLLAGRQESSRHAPRAVRRCGYGIGSVPATLARTARGACLLLWLRLGRVTLMAGLAAAVIAPWLARNYAVHGEFVFIKSTFGYAFWQGNNPSSWGTDKIPKPSAEVIRRQHDGTLAGMDRALWEARHETLYIDDVLLKPTGYRQFAGLSEPERSRLLGREAWEYVRAHPGQYAKLCLQRLRYFLLFDETNPKAANPVYRAATVAWLVLAGVGLWLSRRDWRRLWPTYAIFAAVTLFHAMTIVSARFRIPIEPLSLVWAAYTLAPIAERFMPAGRASQPAL